MPGQDTFTTGELSVPLNSSDEREPSTVPDITPAALLADLAVATGIPAAGTRRQNVCRVALVFLAGTHPFNIPSPPPAGASSYP